MYSDETEVVLFMNSEIIAESRVLLGTEVSMWFSSPPPKKDERAPKTIKANTQQTIKGKIIDFKLDDFLAGFGSTFTPHFGQNVFPSSILAPHFLQYINILFQVFRI